MAQVGRNPTATESGANLTWNWSIPTNENTTTQGKIKIVDNANPAVYDDSTGLFSVRGAINVTAPTNTSEVMTYNGGSSNYNITWQNTAT